MKINSMKLLSCMLAVGLLLFITSCEQAVIPTDVDVLENIEDFDDSYQMISVVNDEVVYNGIRYSYDEFTTSEVISRSILDVAKFSVQMISPEDQLNILIDESGEDLHVNADIHYFNTIEERDQFSAAHEEALATTLNEGNIESRNGNNRWIGSIAFWQRPNFQYQAFSIYSTGYYHGNRYQVFNGNIQIGRAHV